VTTCTSRVHLWMSWWHLTASKVTHRSCKQQKSTTLVFTQKQSALNAQLPQRNLCSHLLTILLKTLPKWRSRPSIGICLTRQVVRSLQISRQQRSTIVVSLNTWQTSLTSKSKLHSISGIRLRSLVTMEPTYMIVDCRWSRIINDMLMFFANLNGAMRICSRIQTRSKRQLMSSLRSLSWFKIWLSRFLASNNYGSLIK